MRDLSYVIPAYNAQEWLAMAIGSCVASQHKNVEIIVVNDGSTDATKRIADWYASRDERVIPVHLDKNVGSGQARNIGSEKASSPYIAMLDADDESTANRATETLRILREKGDGLVYGSCVTLDSLGNNMGTLLATPFNLEHSLKERLAFMVHSTLAYPVKFWQHHPYDKDEYVKLAMEDWKFEMEAALEGYPIHHTQKVLCGHRIRNGQNANRDHKKALEVKNRFLEEKKAIERVLETLKT